MELNWDQTDERTRRRKLTNAKRGNCWSGCQVTRSADVGSL